MREDEDDLDARIAALESQIYELEMKRGIYGWGSGNEGFEMLSMDNEQRIESIRQELESLRQRRQRRLRRSRRYRDDDY